MVKAFIFAGQSNMSAYSPLINLGPTVPGYAQTAGNEWTGAPPRSIDSNIEYPYPTLANSPCLFNSNTRGQMDGVFDTWGAFAEQSPQFNSGGALGMNGSYGLELSFLASAHAAFPTDTIACVKQSLGGTSLAADWMPANTGSNTGAAKLQWTILSTMIAQAAARLDTSHPGNWEWAGFVWMQGESGAHSAGTAASDALYLSNARLFFAAVRSLTRADLPVLIGRIGDNWTNTNPYLIASGYPWAAIDYSINNTDGRIAGSQTTRDSYLAGALARRATQVTLGSDPHCAWWSNDGYPTRPPYSLTAATTDLTGYHWGGPGNLAAGERAFAAYQALLASPPPEPGYLKLATSAGSLLLRTHTATL